MTRFNRKYTLKYLKSIRFTVNNGNHGDYKAKIKTF